MPKFLAQRYLPGDVVYPHQWIDVPAPGKEHEPDGSEFPSREAAVRNALDRIQAGDFGVVRIIRVVQILEYRTIRS